ncbi:MAG: hypothetical protein ABI621_01225 [Chloroflexota bacterium]
MKIPAVVFTMIMFISSCARSVPANPGPTPSAVPFPATSPTPTATATLTPALIPSDSLHLEPFGRVHIDTADIKFNVNGSGSNVDSIAFWEAPDPAESLMIVTSKGNESIEVYKYPFTSELTTISCGGETNGIWVDQDRNVLYSTERNSSNICAFDLPTLEKNEALSFSTAATGSDSEPNLAMLVLPNGQRRIYVSYDDTVFYHDAETGNSLGEFTPSQGLETMYGDDDHQVLYIPDENGKSGVYIYDPDGNPVGSGFGGRSIFDSDAEGIWVYKCPSTGTTDNGEGLILVSDQKEDITDFEVFHRKTKEHLGTLNISGVFNTDGIAITQQVSPDYPLGLLAVIVDDTSTVGIGWDSILEKTGLSCGS